MAKRRPEAPQERAPLTRAAILEAALAVVDAEGLEALRMRRLGAALGVEAMSLYNHFPSKDAVLDGLVELILSEMAAPPPARDWTGRLRGLARAFRRALLRHPAALPLFATRPAATEASLRHVERALGVLRDAGFGADGSVTALQVLVTFVVGHALSTGGAIPARPRYEALSPAEFPRVLEAAAALPAHDVDQEFEVGLDALLIGLRAKASTMTR